MIYDIALNFMNIEDFYEWYEWEEKDQLTYMDKIPILKISTKQMKEIRKYQIQLSKKTLKKIEYLSSYDILLRDNSNVIGVSFNKEGVLLKKSSLRLDEEEAVLEESENIPVEYLSYRCLKPISNFLFLTRREKRIQKYLLEKIGELYQNHHNSELHYLYREIFSDNKTKKEEYQHLVDILQNQFHEHYQSLYSIIQLISIS